MLAAANAMTARGSTVAHTFVLPQMTEVRRFSLALVVFLKECLARGLDELAREASVNLTEKLAGFRYLVISDGTPVLLATYSVVVEKAL